MGEQAWDEGNDSGRDERQLGGEVVDQESPAENWGIRGGHAACDIDLGFDVNV